MKRILVPTDFSPAADRAFHYAVLLAERSGAELIVLNALSLPLPAYAIQPEGIQEYNQCRVAEAGARFADYRVRCSKDIPMTTLVVNGELKDAVQNAVERYDPELLVMGTRGAEGLRTVLGTNAAAVLAACTVPVLVVPVHYSGGLPARIVLAVENEERESLLAPVFRLQALCGATLRTLHVTEENTDLVRRKERAGALSALSQKWEADFGLDVITSEVISGNDVNESLEKYVRDQQIDLVAMVTHRKRGLQALFHKSLTREQAFHTRVPLLSLHA
ncbi:MAG: hypothetical protein EOO12_13445 [Chitinophagaceae bacterium]|nr:MAG: hypothetical protein EOO12_13445 [Chitinophagaceae bacterium]